MQARSVTWAVALVWCSAVVQASADTSAVLVEPPAQAAFDLSNVPISQPNAAISQPNAATSQHIVVPFTPEAGAEIASVRLMSVALGDRAMPSLITGLTGIVADNRELAFDVGFERLWEPGTYTASFLLAGTVTAQYSRTPATQAVTLQLTLRPATLRSIQPIAIADARWRPFRDADVRTTITLAELSKRTGITHLVVEQIGRATMDGVETDAVLSSSVATGPKPVELPAGERLAVTLNGTGFQTGTTRGSLAISGAQLAQSITVAYEVQAKIVDYYIIPWFLVFGVFGWLVRHHLKNREAKRAFRAQVAPLCQRVDKKLATLPNNELYMALSDARDALDNALRNEDQAAAQRAVDDLRSELQKVIAATQKDLDQATRSESPVDPLFLRPVQLPRIRVIRGVASAFLLSVIAWAVYRGAWWGTIDDLLKLAVAGFFADYILDAVLDAVAKRRPGNPGAASITRGRG